MKIETLDSWIWRLIFGGMFIAGLGIATQRAGEPIGWVIVAAGCGAVVAGVVMIFMRSRMREP